MEELVSVIVPVFNVERYLEDCLNGICAQTYKNLEIIVIDDGSTDGSPAICDAFAARDERVKVVHKENGGVSAARNAGLDMVHGEYIFFADSDDVAEKDAIETLYGVLKNLSADFVMGAYSTMSEDGTRVNCTKDSFVEGEIDENEFWKYVLNGMTAIIPTTKLYKKEVWENLRYPKGLINEDLYILPEILRRSSRIGCTNKRILKYRLSQGSIMRSEYSFRRLDEIEAYISVLEYLRDKNLADVECEMAKRGMRVFAKSKKILSLNDEQKAVFKDKYFRYRKVIKKVPFSGIKEYFQVFLFTRLFNIYMLMHAVSER